MKLKYFKLSEFDSPDKLGSGENMQKSTLLKLDDARNIANIPFKINSGFRTKYYNNTLKNSVSNSSHLLGYAVDISCNDSRQRSIIILSLLAVGFTRIGISKTFIHVDNDPNKIQNVIWTY